MTDKQIIRELAKMYMELACSPEQEDTNARVLATNDLKIVRPPVMIEEIPWYQIDIDGELRCLCAEPRARWVETVLRQGIYRRKHFRADALLTPFLRVPMHFSSTGIGWEADEDQIRRTDDTNHIISHHYRDVLELEEDLERFRMPRFLLDPQADQADMDYYSDLLGDVMPARLNGHGFLYFMPWDIIARLRGLEPILYDLYDRPEHLHRIMELLVAAETAKVDFLEERGLFDPLPGDLHCTGGMVSGLAASGPKATWFRGAAQGFGPVSPAMHEEFELRYIRPLAERFAYTYYGCCEPLDKKVDILRSIRNLRKVGVSPWADVDVMARQLKGDYVYSRKPNPAFVAVRTDPEQIRRETEAAVKACLTHGCPCDITLKDISTVNHRPENLIVWAQTVSDVLDQYYG